MARRFTSRPHRTSKRTSVWLQWNIGSGVIAANTAVLFAGLNAAAKALRPFTIIRSHLLMAWQSDQLAATEAPLGAAGLIVVSDPSVGVGISAVPNPIDEADSDFFVYQALWTQFDFLSAIGFQGNSGLQYKIDSKAMRKVDQNMDIAVTVTNQNATEGAIFTLMGRMLIKLH